MADQPLPMLYNELTPLSSSVHAGWKARPLTTLHFLKGHHMVPLAAEEFIDAGRSYPIIFSDGDEIIPLALMGLNEGINVFVSEDGKLADDVYLPAYVRRYPYMLVRMSQNDGDTLTLCFDSTPGTIGPDVEGFTFFQDGEPSQEAKDILAFCESFEVAGQKSVAFTQEMKELGLLTDGEFTFQLEGRAEPFVYRGFRIIDEKKLFELRGDQLRKLNQSGALSLIYAHLFSLRLINGVFQRQLVQNPDFARSIGVEVRRADEVLDQTADA